MDEWANMGRQYGMAKEGGLRNEPSATPQLNFLLEKIESSYEIWEGLVKEIGEYQVTMVSEKSMEENVSGWSEWYLTLKAIEIQPLN